jgi:PEP-CTERM motif
MANKIFGRFVRTALAAAMLAGAQFAAAADVAAGSVIKLNSSSGTLGGGAFSASVVSGPGFGGPSFQTFCLEYQEHLNYGQSLYVSGVTNATVNGTNDYYTSNAAANPEGGLHTATSDPLGKATEWLFTQFNSNTAAYAGTAALSNSTQRAIWFLEGELYKPELMNGYLADTIAVGFVNAANAAVAGGWTDVGDRVRVLNLFGQKKDRDGHYYGAYSENAQDQLYMVSAVPEPETYAMMLAGLGLMGTIARRRKNKNA